MSAGIDRDDAATLDASDEPGSVWAGLRAAHRDAIASKDPLYLEITAGLVVKFRYVPVEDTREVAKRLAKMTDPIIQAASAAADTLVLACEELFVVRPDGEVPIGESGQALYTDPLVPLSKFTTTGAPVRFDETFASGMGWQNGTALTARQIVRKAFDGNDQAIGAMAEQVGAWVVKVGGEARETLAKG